MRSLFPSIEEQIREEVEDPMFFAVSLKYILEPFLWKDEDGFLPGLLRIKEVEPKLALDAYKKGFFPWGEEGEEWFSPNPRMVIFPHKLRIHRSLKKFLKKHTFMIKVDTQYQEVVRLCRDLREESWLSPSLEKLYKKLHSLGYSHSLEVFYQGKLVGGILITQIGSFLSGESMFHLYPNASKALLCGFIRYLEEKKIPLFDAQVYSPHIALLGGEEIYREDFLLYLKELIDKPLEPNFWQEFQKKENLSLYLLSKSRGEGSS